MSDSSRFGREKWKKELKRLRQTKIHISWCPTQTNVNSLNRKFSLNCFTNNSNWPERILTQHREDIRHQQLDILTELYLYNVIFNKINQVQAEYICKVWSKNFIKRIIIFSIIYIKDNSESARCDIFTTLPKKSY